MRDLVVILIVIPVVLGIGLFGLGALVVAWMTTWYPELRPSTLHRCGRCDYELAGLPKGSPCPECGRATP